jgi:hypothetical protein
MGVHTFVEPYPVARCPWCKKLGQIKLVHFSPVGYAQQRMQWEVGCFNRQCKVQPRTKGTSHKATLKRWKRRHV